MSKNWKDMLQKQQEDLDRLEALDAEITADTNTAAAEADKVLKKNTTFGVSFGAGNRGSSAGAARSSEAAASIELSAGLHTLDLGELDVDTGAANAASPSRGGSQSAREARPSSGRRSAGASTRIATSRDDASELGSPGGATPTPTAADAATRFHKAKATQLAKQLADSEELRRRLQEQNSDLQRTLKSEREESKNSRRQIQLLETDARREARRPSNTGGASSSADPTILAQEIASLRKDLQTAERLAKSADASSVAKDAQVKRATEAVARLKAQLAEARSTDNASNTDDRARAEAAEARVRVLEKQRGDLVAAFKKQMKLVDVLKRQKMHVEAARLLAFTEEEFVKTLDWSL